MEQSLIDIAQNIDVAEENFTSKFMSCVRKCVPEKTTCTCITICLRDKPRYDSMFRKTMRSRGTKAL